MEDEAAAGPESGGWGRNGGWRGSCEYLLNSPVRLPCVHRRLRGSEVLRTIGFRVLVLPRACVGSAVGLL
jgi:hypothetical protein